MIERDDDDDLRMSAVLSALRRHVVRVSAGFGARLGVRLLAISAARDKRDPTLLGVFAAVMSEALSIVSAPLAAPPPPVDEGAPKGAAPAPAPPPEKDEDDA